MILTIILALGLFGSWLHGQRIGLLATILKLISYILAWIVAKQAVDIVLPYLPASLSNTLGRGIIAMISFSVIMAGWRYVKRQLHWLTKLPVIGTLNAWLGGAVYLMMTLSVELILLLIFQHLTVPWWQHQLQTSLLAQWMLHQVPLLTNYLQTLLP